MTNDQPRPSVTPRVGDTITTTEQRDALPKGAVLARVHSDGSGPTVYVNERRMGWLMATEQITPPSVSDLDAVGNRLGHLTVLYVPGEQPRPTVTDDARADEGRSEYTVQQTAAHFARRVQSVSDHIRSTDYQRSVTDVVVLGSVQSFLDRIARDDLDVYAASRAVPSDHTATTEDAARVIYGSMTGIPDRHPRAIRKDAEIAADALAAAGLLATARPDTTTDTTKETP